MVIVFIKNMKIEKRLGFVNRATTSLDVVKKSFNASRPYSYFIEGAGGLFGPFDVYNNRDETTLENRQVVKFQQRELALLFQFVKDELVIYNDKKGERQKLGAFSLKDIHARITEVMAEKKGEKKYKQYQPLTFDSTEAGRRLRLYVTNFNYSEAKENAQFNAMNYIKFSLFIEDAQTL